MATSPLRAYREKPEVTHNELCYIQNDFLWHIHTFVLTHSPTHTGFVHFVHVHIHISQQQQKHMTVNNIL